MIELRWLHDPSGQDVIQLQWRELDLINPPGIWKTVPHYWPTEQHAKGIAVKVSSPLAKE